MAAPVPVLAAGVIADGRGVAAALAQGAAGALIGTRFQASAESPATDLIHDLPSAADLVGFLAAQAEEALTRAGQRGPANTGPPG